MSDGRSVILVVDDEESMRYFLRKTLVREGYDVIEAEDGPAAIAAAQTRPPDVALLDVRMPGMDGVVLMRALRATLPNLPVILMTAYGSVQNALQAMKQGATDYVTKPFRVDAIRTSVAKALAREPIGRPRTLRDVRAPGEAQHEPVPAQATQSPSPRSRERLLTREELPARGIVPFLRERVDERGLPAPASTATGDLGLREVVRLAELVFVDELLRLTAGNVSRAADVAGITRPNMHRKIIDLGLSADDYRRIASRGNGNSGGNR